MGYFFACISPRKTPGNFSRLRCGYLYGESHAKNGFGCVNTRLHAGSHFVYIFFKKHPKIFRGFAAAIYIVNVLGKMGSDMLTLNDMQAFKLNTPFFYIFFKKNTVKFSAASPHWYYCIPGSCQSFKTNFYTLRCFNTSKHLYFNFHFQLELQTRFFSFETQLMSAKTPNFCRFAANEFYI